MQRRTWRIQLLSGWMGFAMAATAWGQPPIPKLPTVKPPAVKSPSVKPPAASEPAAKPPADTTAKSAAAKEAAEKPIEGTLEIGNKTYKLTSVAVFEVLEFDQPVIAVLASDKPIPVDKLKAALAKDGTDGSFMLWQPHIKVVFNPDGKPRSLNAWADNHSVSVAGGGVEGELALKEGVARGKFTMPRDEEAGRSCSFTFASPLIANPTAKKLAAQKAAEEKRPQTAIGIPNDDEDDDAMPAAGGDDKPKLSAYQLPLPKDAANVNYKALVGQMTFGSKAGVAALAASFGNQLAAAGWKKDGSDLVTPKSAILKRKQGAAELTIFIKPAADGSTVTMMTEGLNWDPPAEDGDE